MAYMVCKGSLPHLTMGREQLMGQAEHDENSKTNVYFIARRERKDSLVSTINLDGMF